jgi:protein gp37
MDFTPQEHPDKLMEPLSVKKPSIIFLGSTGDITEDAIRKGFVERILEVIRDTPQHTYMLLTKHPEKLGAKLSGWDKASLHNLWVGVTITKVSDLFRLNDLNETAKYHHTFWSLEPLFDDIAYWIEKYDFRDDIGFLPEYVIVGGITPGKPLHETHPEWLQGLIAWCNQWGITIHYKHQGRTPEFMEQVWDARVGVQR